MENQINKNFWKDRRVLVTGNSGFIGNWLNLWLNSMGAKIYGYSNGPTTNPSLYDAGNFRYVTFNPYYQSTWGINNKETLRACFNVANPEIVIHLAHQSAIGKSPEDISRIQKENALGMTTLLDVCKDYPSIKVIIGNVPDNDYTSDNLDPNNPEIIFSSFYQNFFEKQNVGMAITKIGNVIGGGNFTDDLLAYCIRSYAENKIAELDYNKNNLYSHLHVLDLINGYIGLCIKLWENPKQYSCNWIFSNDKDNYITVQEVTNIICSVLGGGATVSWKDNTTQDTSQDTPIIPDNTKTKEDLNWAIKLNAYMAIEKTIQWHKDFLAKKSILHICQKQIEEYIG